MESSLLTTKLNIPPARPQMVPRSRLMERLQEGLNHNLVLVSAPAGFGKTTLLSEWSRHSISHIRTAWVSLDEGDNDPIRFWDYFVSALKTLQSTFGENTLNLLHSPQPPPIESLLTVLLNELAVIPFEFVLVLDDFHFITSQQIHDGIAYLVEHMAAQMHLIIATRADPPLPLPRFRGKGMMLEIRTDDLRFTLEDAVRLLKEMKTPELSTKDVAALNERTEGWAVGLKMAALSINGQKDIPGFIASFTGSQRYVMDYLMEEVLQKQAEETRNFLRKTSVLKRLTVPLCDAVTGRKDSDKTLLWLERAHLFIVPLDESRQWYRYEHLFVDILRHQLVAVSGEEEVSELHRRASQWFEDNHFPDEAIEHDLAAHDWERAMRLIYARCEELRKLGEWTTLLGWFQQIPDEELRKQYQLYSQYASALTVFNQVDAAEAALTYLENNIQDDAGLQGDVIFSLCNLARMRGDIQRAVELGEKALSILPPDNTVMRCRIIYTIGTIRYNSGLLHEAEAKLNEAIEIGRQAGDYTAVYSALACLGGIAHWRGQLHRAEKLLKNAIELAGQMPIVAASLVFLAKVFYELNDLEGAAEKARLSIEWSERLGIAEAPLIAYYFLARVRLSQDDISGAEALMIKMDRASQHPTVSPPYRARHVASRAMFAVWQHDLKAVTDWCSKLSDYGNTLVIEYQHVPPRLLIAQGKKEEAANLLRGLYDKFIRVGADGLAINIRAYQALAAENEAAALEYISDALVKGEPESYIRTFVDEGRLLKPLLQKALSKGITPEYTSKLLTIIKAEERQRQKTGGAAALLSKRELEILRLLVEEFSNKQITDRLNISLSTVKTHIHNILEKMNAGDRSQAVSRARELKLV